MKRLVIGAAALSIALLAPLSARNGRPDTVFFEDLTFDEIREAIAAGAKNVIIATGGVEDRGPALAAGTPTGIVTDASDRVARGVGGTLVAPVIAYAPGGLVSVPAEKGYAALLEAAATSVKGSGFRNIFLLGESASSQDVLKAVADKLDTAWKADGVRVVHVQDYFGKPGKVEAAVAQIRAVLGPLPAVARSAKAGDAPPPAARGSRVLPTPHPLAASRPSRFLEDLTPAEIRDAIAAGSTLAIVPTGGTEKNGFHMAVGKHNFHARAGAEGMAKKLGNALIAPVLQYVPEGQATIATPGVLSCPRACFEPVVAAVAESLKALGFKDVLLVGDNGGNQTPLGSVAALLNDEWEGSGVRAFALTDFYEKSHEYQDAWFLGQFGWDESVVGSHAGIKDTSQLLWIKPESVRTERIADSFNNRRESGVSGDPTKATAEFGRVAIEFKANAAIAQYRALKVRPAGAAGERPARRTDR